jgi:hypothetical protein
MRDHLLGEEMTAALTLARACGEDHPVFWFIPETESVNCFPRSVLLEFLRERENSPELWDLLKQESHPVGMVFYFLAWGDRHSYLQTIALPRGLPEHN